MKKLLLSILSLFCICIYANAQNEAITGWGTKTDTSYGTRTNGSWEATNAALVQVGDNFCPTLNGKTTAKGTLTSPTLSNGINALTLKAANTYAENKGISLKAEIKQNDATVATHDFTVASIEKNEIFSETWEEINVTGDYVIVITNNSPSNSTSNKDRVSITSLSWEEAAVVNPAAPDPVKISSEIDGTVAKVTLTCDTEGADIYYGFSEDAMDNQYSAPFSVTEKCTVYAYAKKGEESGNTRSLKIFPPYTNFSDVVTKADNAESVLIRGNFEVLYAQGKTNLILTDGTTNILLYQPAEEYAVGTKISEVDATATTYHSLFELSQPIVTEGGTGATYVPAEITDLSTINYDDNLLDLIVIKNCTISGKAGNDATIELGDESVALRNTFGCTLENGIGYDITGFVWRYDDTLQIVPTLIEGGNYVETVKTPVITPDKRELNPNDLVTITCATEGATIYYTLDESEPTQDSEKYTAPIEFTESCTIMARAYYEGDDKEMLPSEVASKKYHVFDPYCNVIDTEHEGASSSAYIQHTCTVDGVDYSMIGIHNNTKGIQMSNKKDNSDETKSRIAHILQTSENEGLVVNGIAIDINENKNNVTFQVRGANKPFEYTSYSDNNFASNGKKIGELSNEVTSIEFPADYKYFVIYPTLSMTNAVYLNSVTITYRDPAPLTAPAVLGLEHLDENEILVDEDENTTYVFTDISLDIDFDVDLDSDIKVEYVLVGQEEEVAEDAEYTVYDGSSIEITESAKLVYYAVNTKTNEKTAPVTYVFDIDEEIPAPAAPELVEGDYTIEDGYIKSKDVVKINFKTVDGTHIYYSVGAAAPALRACTDDHAGYTKHEGEEIELTKQHTSFTFYSCDPTTGAHSAPVTYQLAVATGIDGIEAEESEALYFNLQGVQIAKPENGAYIRVIKGKADKMIK